MCFLFCEDKKSVKIRNVKITFGEYHFCYAQISFLGYIFLKERVGKKKLLGLACILCGIVVSNL